MMTWIVYDVYRGEKPNMSYVLWWAWTIAPDRAARGM